MANIKSLTNESRLNQFFKYLGFSQNQALNTPGFLKFNKKSTNQSTLVHSYTVYEFKYSIQNTSNRINNIALEETGED
jgi:hypothetical protein